MAINAGTVMAYLDLDTSKFGNALQLAQSQMGEFAQEGGGISGMLDGLGSAMTTTGRALTMGVTAPLLGAGVAVTKWASDFQVSANKVATIADTTVLGISELNKGTLAISTSTGIAASEINEALYQTISATGDTANALAYTEIAAKAAVGGFTNTETAINGLTTVMNAYGMTGEDAMQRVSDQMLMAQNYGKTTFGEMASYIGYVIPLTAQLGVGTDELFGSIAALTKQGIATSQSITGLKAAYSNIIKPTSEAAKVAKSLGLDFSASALESKGWVGFLQDVVDKTGGSTEIMAQLFGSVEALNTIMALTSEQGMKDLANGMEMINEGAGATDAAYETMMTGLSAGITRLKTSFQNFGISLGNIILPYAEKAVAWLQKGVAWLNGLNDGTKKIIVTVAGIAAAIGPALLVGGKMLSLFSGVIPLLALVAGGFALVYKHSERLQGYVQILKENIPVWMDGIKTGYDTFTAAMQDGQGTIDAAQQGLEAVFGPRASANIGRALRAVQTGFRAAKGAVADTVSGVGEFIGSLMDGEGVAEALRQALETAFGQAFALRASGVITRIDNAFNALQGTALTFAHGTREAFGELWDGIAADYETGGLVGVMTGLGSHLYELLKTGATAAMEGAHAVRDKIAEGLTMTKAWLAPKVQTWMGNLGDAYAEAKSYATDKLPAVKDAILDALTSTRETVVDKAQGVMTWIGDAYRSETAQGYLGDLSGVASTIWDKIQIAKSTLTEKAGEWLNNLGTALGSEEAKAKVQEITGAAAIVAEKIVSKAGVWKTTAATLIGDLIAQLTDNGFLETAITGLGGIVTAIAKGIGSAAENITSCAADLIGKLSDKFAETGFIESVFTTAGDIVLSIAGALVNSAGNIASAASSIAVALLDGLTALDWATIFTRAGEIVTSIAKVLSENAEKIGTAALDLGLKLLEGLATVDWATISYGLGEALGNMVTAISNWFTVPANIASLVNSVSSIFGGILEGLVEGFKKDVEKGFGISIDVDPDAILKEHNLKWEGTALVTVTPEVEVNPKVNVNTLSQDAFDEYVANSGTPNITLTGMPVLFGPEFEVDPVIVQEKVDAVLAPFTEMPEETKAQAALMMLAVNEAIVAGTPEALAAIEVATTAVLDSAKAVLNGEAGSEIGSTFITGIMSGALTKQGLLAGAMRGIGSVAAAAIASMMSAGTGYGIGQSMIQAVISGAGSMASALISRMHSLGSSAVSAFKSAIRMSSPPKAFTEIGEAIPDAVGIGTDNNREAAINPIVALARDLQSAFSVSLDDENMTHNTHKMTVSGSQNTGGGSGFSFNFYGDMTVRDDSDIERVSRQIYEDIQDALRGGGALA